MKKAISFLLILSVLILSGSLYAKKNGAELVIVKLDGQQVRGELIAVKENSLLLQGFESGTDVSVEVDDIQAITIIKNSKALLGAGIGLLSGGILGAALGAALRDSDSGGLNIVSTKQMALAGGIVFGILGVFVGGGIGNAAGKDKVIQFEGASAAEIKVNLAKLRNKARIPDFQ